MSRDLERVMEALARDRADVERALAIDHGLDDWEVEFVESLGRRVIDARRPLSEKQRVHLDRILEGLE